MAKSSYIVQWDEQPIYLSKFLSSLVESQTLVDLTVNCNSYTIKVHKCILAANSTYFRDYLQKDMSIDRVVINGIKHVVMKSLIEFMYCGETSIPEDSIDELVAAAKFFCIRGITSIIPQKLGAQNTERVAECNLINKPPLFFSKNDKKYSFKEKDSNYSLFDNSGRRKHTHSKVTDEAHVALAKEEAASRFALEMLKKDINNTSNVFVIDETCTEATVETNLTAQYENANNMMQIQQYVIQNDIKTDNSDLVNESSNIDINNLLPKTKQSPNDDRINELANVPMLYKPTDGSYVNVNVSNQILETLSNSHAITYHVMPEDGNVDFQQYICNNFGQYSVHLDSPQQESSYKIVNNTEPKKPLTYNQLVADTVSSDYDSSSYGENSTPFDAILTKEENDNFVANEGESSKLVTDEIFAQNYDEHFGADILDVQSKDVLTENIVPKRKRGRPPKRKLADRNIENESSLIFDQKRIISDSNDNIDQNPQDMLDDSLVENENSNETSEEIDLCNMSKNDQASSISNENRRQTRSSLKFNIC